MTSRGKPLGYEDNTLEPYYATNIFRYPTRHHEAMTLGGGIAIRVQDPDPAWARSDADGWRPAAERWDDDPEGTSQDTWNYDPDDPLGVTWHHTMGEWDSQVEQAVVGNDIRHEEWLEALDPKLWEGAATWIVTDTRQGSFDDRYKVEERRCWCGQPVTTRHGARGALPKNCPDHLSRYMRKQHPTPTNQPTLEEPMTDWIDWTLVGQT